MVVARKKGFFAPDELPVLRGLEPAVRSTPLDFDAWRLVLRTMDVPNRKSANSAHLFICFVNAEFGPA